MAVGALQPDLGLIGSASPAGLPSVVSAAELGDGRSDEFSGGNHLQNLLWQDFLLDPTDWWDNRRSKETALHPDLRHTKRKDALWFISCQTYGWVQPQIVMLDAPVDGVINRPLGSITSSFQRVYGMSGADEDVLKAGMSRKVCEDGQITAAVDKLNILVQRGCHLEINLFYCVLKRCIAQKDLVLGRRIHALSVEAGYEGNAFLATHFIGLYAYHGRLGEAMGVFSKVGRPTAYMWSSIIFAYARHGKPAQAIGLYLQMRESAVMPDNRVFLAVLKACARAGDLAVGRDVHAQICASPVKPDMFVQNSLVDMYAKCGSLEDARRLFDALPCRNVVTWNAIIAGYSQQGMGQEALALFSTMQQEAVPNTVTFVCLLQACASAGAAALHQGKHLHLHIEERGFQADVVVGNSLLNMYTKCGSLEDACEVFDRLPHKDVVTWTTMIAGYSQQGMGVEALRLYRSMQEEGMTPPNSVTFVCLLQACASVGVAALHYGKQLHMQIRDRGLQGDSVVGNSLINMYASCGNLEDARKVFDRLPHIDVLTWNAMIAGYSKQGMGKEALRLYNHMQQEGMSPPNSSTFVCLLQACASVAAMPLGKQLHVQIEELGLQADVVVTTSLVNMYAKCGSLEDAQRVFNGLPQKDVVAWNAMIAGYAQQGMGLEALSLYRAMQQEGITSPNSVTFACLLQACGSVVALPVGKHLHAQIEERGLQTDMVVGASLVNMYAKCGSLEDAQRVFDSLPEREIVVWGALIAGYARHGDSDSVFDLVDRMRKDGIEPDGMTMLSVLTVCSHAGLLEKGRRYFEAMTTDYGISPTNEHYLCMVDLLGRAGHLDEALAMAKHMPFQSDCALWHTLLGACQKWSNVEVGRQAFDCAVRVDERSDAAYVLMTNIYASAQMWEEAKEMQARRERLSLWKEPGQSWWTDKDGVRQSFVVGVGTLNLCEGEGQ